MTSYLLDLSNAPGERNELADVEVPVGHPVIGLPDSVRVLNVSRCNLYSLDASPPSHLHGVLQHVTTLHAPFNKLSSLAGIDAFVSLEVLNLSHNALTVIDASTSALLHRLHALQVVDLSHNKLRLLDLCAPPPHSAPGGSASPINRSWVASGAWELQPMGVKSLNLSHNAFVELPDLRLMPSLQVLNLNHNLLDDLVDLDAKVPLLSLHTLQLRGNRLAFAASAIPLAALANTLHHLQITGNPFTGNATSGRGEGEEEEMVTMSAQASRSDRGGGSTKTMSDGAGVPSSSSRHGSALASNLTSGSTATRWWWRPFLLWLAPLLQTLDTAELTASERTVTAMLFRERSGAALSKTLLELLNANRREELEVYLHKQGAHATAPANLLDTIAALEDEDRDISSVIDTPVRTTTSAAATAANGMSPGSTASAVNDHVAALTAPQPHKRATYTASVSSASPAVVLTAIQQKLRSLTGVVEILWRHDLARRTFAAITIQRVYRGFAVRRDLPEDVRESLLFIRQQLQLLARVSAALAFSPSPASAAESPGRARARASHRRASVDGEMANATAPVVASGNEAADIREVLNTMKGLQSVMMTMWDDLDAYRAMAEREQRRAAITIQRHYRGYRDRLAWRQLKSGYDEFVDALDPFARLIQRVGRGYRARQAIRLDLDARYEVRRLRNEVGELRAEMQEMRAMLGLAARATPSSQRRPSARTEDSSSGLRQQDGLRRSSGATGQYQPPSAERDRGMYDYIQRRLAARPLTGDRSQSATASILNDDTRLDEEEDEATEVAAEAAATVARSPGDHDVPNGAGAAAAAPANTSSSDDKQDTSPTADAHYLAQSAAKMSGSAPLRPGVSELEDSREALSETGSDSSPIAPRLSGRRVVKRRPSSRAMARGGRWRPARGVSLAVDGEWDHRSRRIARARSHKSPQVS